MAGLEGLTPQQRDQLALGAHTLLSDPSTSKATKKLLKQLDPKLSFPELEVDDQIEAAVKPLREQNEKLVNDQKEREFRLETERQHNLVKGRGYKVEDVQKLMQERGIVNFATACDLLDMQSQLAPTTPESLSGVYDMPEENKEIFKNPAQWARKTAHNLIDQFKRKKVAA